ncbi:MAG: hypothetical protein AAGI15_05035 [Pseudomonadota bacterium]
MDALLLFALLATPFLVVGWLIVRWIRGIATRGREFQALIADGVQTDAIAMAIESIRQNRAGFKKCYLTYRFQDDAGNAHEKRLRVWERDLDGLREGQTIEVVYLPGQPDINALERHLAETRSALS